MEQGHGFNTNTHAVTLNYLAKGTWPTRLVIYSLGKQATGPVPNLNILY
jgi:hypothetical protein